MKNRQKQILHEEKSSESKKSIYATEQQKAEITLLQQSMKHLHYRNARFYSAIVTLLLPNVLIRYMALPIVRYFYPDYVDLQQGIDNLIKLEKDTFNEFNSKMNSFCKDEHIDHDCFENTAKLYDKTPEFEGFFRSAYRALNRTESINILFDLEVLKSEAKWLTHTNQLFKNLNPDNDPRDQLQIIITQIKELSKINKYKIISLLDILEITSLNKNREKFLPIITQLNLSRSSRKSSFANFINEHLLFQLRKPFLLLFAASLLTQRYLVEPSVFKIYQLIQPKLKKQPKDKIFRNKLKRIVQTEALSPNEVKQLIQQNVITAKEAEGLKKLVPLEQIDVEKLLNKPSLLHKEAEDLIHTLEMRKMELEMATTNASLFTPKKLILIFIGFFVFGSIIDISFLESALFMLTFLSLAFENTFQNLKEKQKQKRFDTNLNNVAILLNKIITGWEPHKKASLSDSYLAWHSHRKENLSAIVVCQVVKNSLINHGYGDAILSCGFKTITMRADVNLSIAKAEEICKEINHRCKRHNQIKLLRQQLKMLSQHIGPFSLFQHSGLGGPSVTFKLSIPSNLLYIVTQDKLEAIFRKHKISFKSNLLKITGHEPIDDRDLKEFLQLIPKFNFELFNKSNQQATAYITTDKMSRIPRGRSNQAPPVVIENKKITSEKKEEKLPQTIRWGKFVFDANDQNCKITPDSTRKNKFICLNLDEKDFPTPDSYTKFQTIFFRRKNAAGFSDQGWRRMQSTEPYQNRDKKGIWQRSDFNIKAKGEFGTLQAYGKTMKDDETGKYSLDVVTDVSFVHQGRT